MNYIFLHYVDGQVRWEMAPEWPTGRQAEAGGDSAILWKTFGPGMLCGSVIFIT